MGKAPLRDLLADVRILPVVTVHRVEQAVPLAGALAEGGLGAIEITLRTPVALEAIRRVRSQLPEVLVGAGTILDAAQLAQTLDAGAQFAVSPGLTAELATAAAGSGLPLLPGVATASEAMAAQASGFDFLKLFPAEAAGGTPLLRALAGPLGHLRFCPTGGLDGSNFTDYLALENVACVGGSWMAPKAAVQADDWQKVTALARRAAEQTKNPAKGAEEIP